MLSLMQLEIIPRVALIGWLTLGFNCLQSVAPSCQSFLGIMSFAYFCRPLLIDLEGLDGSITTLKASDTFYNTGGTAAALYYGIHWPYRIPQLPRRSWPDRMPCYRPSHRARWETTPCQIGYCPIGWEICPVGFSCKNGWCFLSCSHSIWETKGKNWLHSQRFVFFPYNLGVVPKEWLLPLGKMKGRPPASYLDFLESLER